MLEATDHSTEVPLNISELLSRLDNDQELLRELVQLFKDECARLMRSLQDAVSKQEMKAVKTISHSLKGILANLSATRAASAASSLEEIGHAGKHSQLREALAALESEIGVLIPELDACLVDARP
jgi:two-component system, sensor histidine kinase and response regulator